jgi:hypothetical protein
VRLACISTTQIATMKQMQAIMMRAAVFERNEARDPAELKAACKGRSEGAHPPLWA